jgi:hypothetical protein
MEAVTLVTELMSTSCDRDDDDDEEEEAGEEEAEDEVEAEEEEECDEPSKNAETCCRR